MNKCKLCNNSGILQYLKDVEIRGVKTEYKFACKCDCRAGLLIGDFVPKFENGFYDELRRLRNA